MTKGAKDVAQKKDVTRSEVAERDQLQAVSASLNSLKHLNTHEAIAIKKKFAADQRLLRNALSRWKTHNKRIVVLEKLVLGKESTLDRLALIISDS